MHCDERPRDNTLHKQLSCRQSRPQPHNYASISAGSSLPAWGVLCCWSFRAVTVITTTDVMAVGTPKNLCDAPLKSTIKWEEPKGSRLGSLGHPSPLVSKMMFAPNARKMTCPTWPACLTCPKKCRY